METLLLNQLTSITGKQYIGQFITMQLLIQRTKGIMRIEVIVEQLQIASLGRTGHFLYKVNVASPKGYAKGNEQKAFTT